MARSYDNIHIYGKAHLGDSYYLGQSARLADLVPCAVHAQFNASGKDHDPHCLQGTRIDILDCIRKWINGKDDKHIFWLSGLAGTGKSTIARTIAREIYENPKECWMASFFFNRGSWDTGHARKFVGTIATQLANKNMPYRELLQKAVSEDQGIFDRVMIDQWKEVIVSPLSLLKDESSQPQLIIVIDALNECDKSEDIIQILQLLVASRELGQFRPRILITSTPEIFIQESMLKFTGTAYRCISLQDEPGDVVDHDILLFMETELSKVKSLRLHKQQVYQLAKKAAGLFIWANIACRFISGGKGIFREKRLTAIFEERSPGSQTGMHPEKHLDELYLTVLRKAIQKYADDGWQELCYLLRQVLGSIVVLLAPLSLHSLLGLLSDLGDVDIIHEHLEDLCSILDISKDKTHPLRLHHPSFCDFLLNKERCQDENFWINEQDMHRAMMKRCVDLMSELLEKHICDAKLPGVHVSGMEKGQKERYLPHELQYSCLYWVEHLRRSNIKVEDNDDISDFLQAHLLHWLEALSLIGRAPESFHIIRNLQSLLKTDRSEIIATLLTDAICLFSAKLSTIQYMPLQIYTSVLTFAPRNSIMRQKFGIPQWLSFPQTTEILWNSGLETLQNHYQDFNLINLITIPHLRLIASASYDTIWIWFTETWEYMQKTELDSFRPQLGFNPEGTKLPTGRGAITIVARPILKLK
ncbi:uncharacterized protein N7498_010696 [Penicillium cinerascens]|uniref:Nephrocystin 3-like N-terminal domain-containing protein n=1 Tax=Penicillium cinerascens TaxID=70096 RepID=A0A9W9M6N2_9EURO|nr:uncharacterized protein N7498_010696 [Penicillium cinerascens]KAJ5191711.1 hypothetical protein N7498_010696 [Penicillium cinerascens]